MSPEERKVNRLAELLALSEVVNRLLMGWITVTDGHRVIHSGLLRQARDTMLHGTPASDDSEKSHSKAIHSPTPMPEHIFMTIMEAEAEVGILAAVYWPAESSRPTRATPEATLRAMVGAASELEDEALQDLVRELSHVRRRLEVALAWEPADRKLRGTTCPTCEVKDTLWVKIDQHGPASAYCSSCHSTWLPAELADAINDEETTA